MTYQFRGAVRSNAGFQSNNLAQWAGGGGTTVINPAGGTDDGSTHIAVGFGFNINFFGEVFSGAYLNNNGNITMSSTQSTYTPYGLAGGVPQPIIAPFFGDVDTRSGNVMTWGQDVVNGFAAFGVNWIQVGYYGSGGAHLDKLNTFQLILISRPDRGAGDFDIEFNYDSIQWETGDASSGVSGLGGQSAHAGFSNGTGVVGTYYELAGSGVNGALLDSDYTHGLIYRSFNSAQPGRYLFTVSAADGGVPVIPIGPPWTIPTGDLSGDVTSGGNPVSGASVTLVDGQAAISTAPVGYYEIDRIPIGDYSAVTAKAGYYPVISPVLIEPSLMTTLNVALTALSGGDTGKGFVCGWVVDAITTEPLAGASVSAQTSGIDPVTVTTDANGAFTLALLPGTYTLTASDTGYSSSSISWTVATAQEVDVLTPIGLFPTAGASGDSSVYGYASDAVTGAALSGVTVGVVEYPAFSATTGSDGFYEIRGLPAQILTVSGAKSGYRTRYCKVQTAHANNARVDLGLAGLSVGVASVDGYITDCASGLPIQGATAEFAGIVQTLTDASGYYTINDVPVS